MRNILFVEDDEFIAQVITYYLKTKSFHVHWACCAGDALGFARNSYDAIILDVLLPDADGIGLCRQLRKWHDCPIIFVSCLDDSDTVIRALDAGGDDFVTKPFDNDVLLARIEANLRRANHEGFEIPHDAIECGIFSLQVEGRVLRKNDIEIVLPPLEFRLLAFLMMHEGQFFSSEELYRKVWGRDSCGDTRTVLVHIRHLRSKIEDNPHDARYIRNVWGKGYTFCP